VSHWLVTWEWSGEHARASRKIAAIISGRKGAGWVREVVELIYAMNSYDLAEQEAHARRAHTPYPAHLSTRPVTIDSRVQHVTFEGEIVCGHNPWLYGRIVDGLTIRREPESDAERITWRERIFHDVGKRPTRSDEVTEWVQPSNGPSRRIR
jgi:hypothetical protein